MRIVFMGTPEIAAVSLAMLLSDSRDIVAVYTREDKPAGRGHNVLAGPVKRRAIDNRIPLYQPASFKNPQAVRELANLAPDLIVVVAYGLILPPQVLEIPRHGCINLHVSMLPQYRGAAPVQWALINGESKTGITVMQLDEGLDTGPILAQQPVDISPEATAGEMLELVASIGAHVLADTVSGIEQGTIIARPQQGAPSYAPQLKKSDAYIDFERPADQLHNLIRGCNPWPLAWFESGGKRIKVLRAKRASPCGAPGEIVSVNPLIVNCGEGSLQLEHLVPEGGKAMTGTQWAAGRRFKIADRV